MNQDAIRREELRQHPDHRFVARGDPALTRALLARGALRVVDDRRGKLVQVGVAATPAAITLAQAEVAATAGTRAVARERSRERREKEETRYVAAFDAAVRRLFPSIPDRDRQEIVQRTCEVGSRRVGRSAAAKDLEDDPIRLAVRAWIRHGHTDYDQMLDRAGVGRPFGRASKEARAEARRVIRPRVDAVAAEWAQPCVEEVAARRAAPSRDVAAQPAAPPRDVAAPLAKIEHEHDHEHAPMPRPVLRLLPPRPPEPAEKAPMWGRPLARKR